MPERRSAEPEAAAPPPGAPVRRLLTEGALDIFRRASAMRAAGRDIAMLCVGQPDFPPPERALEAAARASRDGPHGYTDSAGLPGLREALAAYHEPEAGRPLDPGRFFVTPGGKNTAWLAMLALLGPGDEALIPDPFFPAYESAARFAGAAPVRVPLREADGFDLDPEAVRALATPRTRVLVCNSPSNPCGRVMPRAKVDRLVEVVLERPGLAVVSDEIYHRIVFGGSEHRSLLAYPELDGRLVMLNGASKTFAMTGWRVGWGHWPEAMLPWARLLCVNSHSCPCNVAQVAAEAAVSGGPPEAARGMAATFERRAKSAAAALRGAPGVASCLEPQGAFYLMPRLAEGLAATAAEAADSLLEEEGLAVNPGTAFGPGGEGFLRLSAAASEEEIADGVARLGRWAERRLA